MNKIYEITNILIMNYTLHFTCAGKGIIQIEWFLYGKVETGETDIELRELIVLKLQKMKIKQT